MQIVKEGKALKKKKKKKKPYLARGYNRKENYNAIIMNSMVLIWFYQKSFIWNKIFFNIMLLQVSFIFLFANFTWELVSHFKIWLDLRNMTEIEFHCPVTSGFVIISNSKKKKSGYKKVP